MSRFAVVDEARELGVVGFARRYSDVRAAAITVVVTLATLWFVYVIAPALGMVAGGYTAGYLHDGSERAAGWAGATSALLGALALVVLFAVLVVIWVHLPSGGSSANTGAPIVLFMLLAALAGTAIAGVVFAPLAWVAGRLGGS